jgi:hypothetical protein
MEILAELGERQLLLEYALRETVPGVVEVAVEALFPEPAELLVHTLRLGRGINAHLRIRYHVTASNYLSAGNEIAALYATRQRRLHPDVIEAAGLAYLKAMAPYFSRYLRAPLVNYAAALRDQGRKAVEGIGIFVGSDGTDTWSRASQGAIEAAIALRRMDEEVDRTEVQRMFDEVPAAMDPVYYRSLKTRVRLRWVIFDAGLEADPRPLLQLAGDRALEVAPDLLTTLLKRQQYRECERIAREVADVYHYREGFCFWPLVNFLESRGLVDVASLSWHPTQPLAPYVRARQLNIDPPPWWRWL